MVEKVKGELKGYVVPDEYLKKRKGYAELADAYKSNPIIYGSVNNVHMSLFSYKKEKHFEIDSSNPHLRRFLNSVLLGQGGFKGLYGQEYDLEGFLRNVLQSLLIFGKAFYRIDWAEKVYEENKTRWVVEGIRWLTVETMDVVKSAGQIRGFKQEYSYNVTYKDLRGISIDFEPEEIFFVEWIFDEGKRGVSPIKRLISLCEEMHDFLEYIGLCTKAMYHPEDSSFAVERARFTSWEKEKRKEDQRKIKIQDALGIMPTAPMTEYYDIYQFIKLRKRIAQIRKYLLDEFNDQIVKRITKKNGFSESAEVKLVGYKSVSEIDEYFSKFKSKELSNKEVVNALLND